MKSSIKIFLRAAILAPIGLAVFSAAASANATLPPRKPGMWATTMTMNMTMNGQTMGGNAPIVSEMCSSAATDAASMKMMTGDTGKCTNFDIEGSGDTYTMNGTCADPMGGAGQMTTHGVITRINDENYHVVSETKSASMSGSMVGDSKWLGACPAGVMPGDFGSVQNGQFVKEGNILDDLNKPPQ